MYQYQKLKLILKSKKNIDIIAKKEQKGTDPNKERKKYKMNILKNNKGITLVALITTVVVLLIISTITISTLTGEHGLIRNSKEAKKTYSVVEEREIINTSVAIAMGKSPGAKVEYNILKRYLDQNIGIENRDYTLEIDATDENYFYITFLGSKNIYTIRADGEITYGREKK